MYKTDEKLFNTIVFEQYIIITLARHGLLNASRFVCDRNQYPVKHSMRTSHHEYSTFTLEMHI